MWISSIERQVQLQVKNEHTQTSRKPPIEEKLLSEDNRLELLRLLSELGTLDRDILVMKLIQGNSSEEIALNMQLFQCTIEERICFTFQKWSSL